MQEQLRLQCHNGVAYEPPARECDQLSQTTDNYCMYRLCHCHCVYTFNDFWKWFITCGIVL